MPLISLVAARPTATTASAGTSPDASGEASDYSASGQPGRPDTRPDQGWQGGSVGRRSKPPVLPHPAGAK